MRIIGRAPKNPYKRTTYGGKTFNWRTRAMLMELSQRLYGGFYELSVFQGSYNTGVGASAGTHDGGGAVDLSANDWVKKVTTGRDIGFAIWHRPTLPGVWNEHVHGIAIGDKEMSSGAASQIVSYRNHRNGLADNGWDSFPHHPVHTFNYQAWRKRYNAKQARKQRDWFDMADKADLQKVVDAAADRIVKRMNEIAGNTKKRDQADADRDADLAKQLQATRQGLAERLKGIETVDKEELFQKLDEVIAAVQAQP